MEQSDVQLIHRILQGDQDAFSPLVKKYQKGVHALVWRKIGDFHIAQEITQDAFLNAYKKLGTLKNHTQFPGWLYVIAANLCSDWLRRNRLPMESLDAGDANEVDKVSYSQYVAEKQATEADETRREVVKKLLQKLPESERTVMTLHYLGEMTIKAISEFLGVSPNTVKSRLRRARNRLKKDEDVIQQNLGSFQLPTQLAENIMREVARITPAAPATSKPMVPWAALGAAAVLVVLMLGVSSQYLARFQKPYSFEAESEPTIEIVDTPIILDIVAKPAVKNQVGRTDSPGKSSSTGTKISDATSASITSEDSAKFSTAQWTQSNGPPGGLVRDIFVAAEGTVYAAAPTGIYKLTTDATAWTRINTSVPINDSLMPMAEHRDTLYIVSTDEIFTSDDRGETWQTLGPRPKGRAVGLIITDVTEARNSQAQTAMYLALKDEGIFRSTDGGTQWQSFNNGLTAEKISALAAIGETVFAGTGIGLYRLDSRVWKKLPVDTSGAVCSLAVSGNNLYVGTGAELLVKLSPPRKVWEVAGRNRAHSVKILHSVDLGDSWTDITPDNKYSFTGPPAGMTVLAGGDTLLALGYAQSRSTDGGQTWSKLGFDQHFLSISSLPAVAVNERTFYKVGVFGVQRTMDGGESWYPFMNGVTGTRTEDLAVFNNRLYAHTGYEFHQSTDGGVSWKNVQLDAEAVKLKVGTNSIFHSRLMVSGDSLYFLSLIENNFRILRLSTDSDVPIPVQGVPTFDEAILPSELWTSNDKVEGIRLVSSSKKDDGSVVTIPDTESRVKYMTAVVSNDVFYAEYRRRLFKWRLGDSEWTDTGFVDTSQPLDEGYYNGFKLGVSGETVYVGKRDGKLFQSLDEGSTWRDITSSLPLRFARFKEITFAGSTVYVATDKGVFVSETGAHWRVITDRTDTQVVINQFAVDGTQVYGVADAGVYRLETHRQWKKISSEVLGDVVALAVLNNKLYAAFHEQGMFHISLEDAADNGLTHQ